MDAREIMIGNVVLWNGNAHEVYFDEEYNYIDYEPIEINENSLVNSQFKSKTNWIGENEYSINLGKYHIKVQRFSNTPDRKWSVHIDNNVYMTVGGGDVQYVHQLQNLIKVLTGEDLLIKAIV